MTPRNIGFTRRHGCAFAAAQAPDKLNESPFHPARLVCRSGPAETEGRANDRGIGKRKACRKRLAAREILSCMGN